MPTAMRTRTRTALLVLPFALAVTTLASATSCSQDEVANCLEIGTEPACDAEAVCFWATDDEETEGSGECLTICGMIDKRKPCEAGGCLWDGETCFQEVAA